MTHRHRLMVAAIIAGAVVQASAARLTPRVFFLDSRGRVLSANPDGSDLKVLVEGRKGIPDGIVVDVAGSHLFWTIMGVPNADDGSIERADMDGQHLTVVVPAGGTFTPKQLKLDEANRKLYWSDREGMRIMRSNLDGSNVETLVETGKGEAARRDAKNWCVGIALDVPGGTIYWTQKGNGGDGSIRRAGMQIPRGETAAHRTDIEVLFDGLPEPIDLDLDLSQRLMYWTDRGDPPAGNTVSRAPLDPAPGSNPRHRPDQQILVTGLREGIGIALDVRGGRMYFTDLGGTVYTASLDGSGQRALLTGQGSLTGIAFAEIPR